ncbi:MAG: hypothetical protein PVG98_00620 [Chromatiales bacterium]|jgi:DNA-binding NtrC family response regulator
MPSNPLLLAIVELGGYPNLVPLYQAAGFRVETLASMRKALAWLKRECPAVVVAEFNFDPMFRDRMGNLESLLATLQRRRCGARVVVLSEKERRAHLERALERYTVFRVLELPVDARALDSAVRAAVAD